MVASTPPELADEERLLAALSILDRVAQRLATRLGLDRDDLRSIGHLALADLIRRHDPERAPFEPYLQQRLRWAIIDGIRKETHGGRAHARAGALRASAQLAAGRARLDPEPSAPSRPQRLSVALREHAFAIGIKLLVSEGSESAVTTSSTSPERLAQRRALFEALRATVAELDDERQRQLIERHYFGGESLEQIASSLGISKGWASRLHASAIARLASRLRGVVSSG